MLKVSYFYFFNHFCSTSLGPRTRTRTAFLRKLSHLSIGWLRHNCQPGHPQANGRVVLNFGWSLLGLTQTWSFINLRGWNLAIHQWNKRRRFPYPPGPKPLPLIGNMLDLKAVTNHAPEYAAWSKKYNSMFFQNDWFITNACALTPCHRWNHLRPRFRHEYPHC